MNMTVLREFLINDLGMELILKIKQLKYKVKRNCLEQILNYILGVMAVIF